MEYKDEETRHTPERHPTLSRNTGHNRTHDSSSSATDISPSSYPFGRGEVIVKIEGSSNKNNDTTAVPTTSSTVEDAKVIPPLREERHILPSREEFSFRRPDNVGIVDEDPGGDDQPEVEAAPTPTSDQMDQQQDLHQRRLGQGGLPPLPRENLTRQSWTRNPSDVQSPDASIFTNYRSPVLNPSTPTSMNFDGSSREIRVSFQESNVESAVDSGNLKRRLSLYSTVESDSSSSSSVGEEDNLEDDVGNHGGNISGRSHVNNTVSFRGLRTISTSRVKSRLMDPAPTTPLEPRSGNVFKSGLLGKPTAKDEDEEDDPFEDDIPDELKRVQISPFVVIEWLVLVAILGALICTLVIPSLKTHLFWKMHLWKWGVLVFVLICGRLVSGWVIRIIVFFIERSFLLRKRVLYFVYGIKTSVQVVLWFGLVLLTWRLLFDERVEREARSEPLKMITRLLTIGEVCALLWLLKTLLVKVCASNFHVNAFFERIQNTVYNQFVIETLSGPPSFELQGMSDEDKTGLISEVQMLQNAGMNVPSNLRAIVFSPSRNSSTLGIMNDAGNIDEGAPGATPRKSPIGFSARDSGVPPKKHGEDNEGITIDDLHKMNQKNVSAWNMKRLMKMVRKGALTTLDDQVEGAAGLDEHANEIRSEVEAKAAAKKIFRNVARPHARYIYLDDLRRFMGEDDAIKTMGFFDGVAETERISKRALKDWVVKAFRERRSLALTLSDTKTAVNKLHQIVNVLVAIIIAIVMSTALGFITSENIVFLCSQLVLVAFVFGNTCKNVFESIIFLFVIHPFDVGDRCEIDGVQMVVEEMNILSTIFLRYDNLKIIFPNYVLLTKPINNYYRSPDMGDGVEFSCPLGTPPEKIAIMRERIMSYIVNKKEHWYPSPMIMLKDIESLHTITMAVWLQHKSNHQDMGARWLRRALLVEECIKIFTELDIEYRVYPVNVNINSMPPSFFPSQLMQHPTTPPFVDRSREVVHA